MDTLSQIIRLPNAERTTLLTEAATEIGFLRDKVRSLENQCEELRREARMALAANEPKSILPIRPKLEHETVVAGTPRSDVFGL